MSSEPITDRRLAILRRRFETMSNVYVGADGCELLDEIERLRASEALLIKVLAGATIIAAHAEEWGESSD